MTIMIVQAAIASMTGRGAESARPSELDALAVLLGEWEASGQDQPGEGSGRTVFTRDLQERVIVRTNYAEYPASGGKPSSRHDDLMVIYVLGGTIRADYYDSESHAIRYRVTSPAAGEALFLSEPSTEEPRYRLSLCTRGGRPVGRRLRDRSSGPAGGLSAVSVLAVAKTEIGPHEGWFFGANPTLPRWTGYRLGFRLVETYQTAHPGATAAVGPERGRRLVHEL
jgi:hypothetical protein